MTAATSHSLPILTAEEDCECLGGKLYGAFLAGAGSAIFFLSLAWLVQATRTAAPGAVWWKSAIALASVLVVTWFLRMARRLDPHCKQGWTISDAALLLAGGFVTAIFVMRGGSLAGALFIAFFIVLESVSLWRLKLLPMRVLGMRRERLVLPTVESTVAEAILPLRGAVSEGLAANEMKSDPAEDLDVAQQFTRRETEEGVEISGFVRGKFLANETTAAVDVAFCPTLSAAPSLEYETLCDEEVDVQVATLRPYGARLELKRKGSAQTELGFSLELHVVCGSEAEADVPIREPAGS